ncbi:MAG TPA: S9 family peptidase, partial [Thermomicrobiales bacterium]|nr:S9 family peptidase [Thermomicrobiales bacterium]
AIAVRESAAITLFLVLASAGELAWSADGTRIAFVRTFDPANPENLPVDPAAVPLVRVVNRIDYKQENRGFLNDVRHQVFVLRLADGSIKQVTNDRIDHLAPVWSPDGAQIATKITTTNGMTSQLCLTTVATGAQQVIGTDIGMISTWVFTPDGTALIYSGDTEQTWQADWFLYELSSGATRRLTDDLAIAVDGGFATISLPAHPIWQDDNHLLYSGSMRGQSLVARLDVESGASETIATWPAVNGGWSATADGKYVVQVQANPDHPGVLVRIDTATGETKTLLDVNTGGAFAVPTCLWERITIERSGWQMDGWLFRPADHDGAATLPLVLNIHGGPNGHHGPAFDAVTQAMVGAGYAVLTTNPRGSTSYGRAFTTAVREDWAGEDYLDQMAFVDEVCKRPYIDPQRLGVYGYSYGGFMTSWIIGHSNRFKAAVIGAPVVDEVSFYGTADIGHTFAPLQIGGTPWSNEDEYRFRSPLTELHKATTPSLILHGENDDRVPIGQGEQAFMTLKQAGCEVEFVRYPTGAHAMLRSGFPAHKVDFYSRVNAWFGTYLPTE